MFAGEKVLDLLYLKNVERIEVLEWSPGAEAPRVVAVGTYTIYTFSILTLPLSRRSQDQLECILSYV